MKNIPFADVIQSFVINPEYLDNEVNAITGSLLS